MGTTIGAFHHLRIVDVEAFGVRSGIAFAPISLIVEGNGVVRATIVGVPSDHAFETGLAILTGSIMVEGPSFVEFNPSSLVALASEASQAGF
jgi:hypothetical protein